MEEQTFWDLGSDLFNNGIAATVINSVIVLLLAKLITSLLKKAFERHQRAGSMPIVYLRRIVTFTLYAIAVFAILSQFRPLQKLGVSLLGATSVVTVLVGLAAQATFGNFISGFIISIYQPFKVGDFVSLPEKTIAGEVKEITFRHTVIRSIENTEYVIPNSVMDSAVIENRAYGQEYYKRIIRVTVGYDSDTELVRKLITETALETPEFADVRTEEEKEKGVPPVNIRLEDFGASGLEFIFFMVSTTLGDSYTGASRIRTQLLEKFRANHITIPYQTIDVHMK